MTPTPSTTVSAAPPATTTAAPAAPGTPASTPPAVDAVAFQRQIDELKEQVAQGQRAAEYWAEKARTATPAPKPAAEADDDVDVLETITTKGAKGFDELAAKRGFIRKNEVEQLIDARATTLTKEQQLIERFPDLRKKDTEFFKATAVHYGDLIKAGTPQAVAMELAADRAELDFMRSGKIKTEAARADETKEQKETARLARIAAQSGEGGGRRPAPVAEDDDEGLTPEQKHIARAMGISEEAYAKRAKAGVSIKGGLGGSR